MLHKSFLKVVLALACLQCLVLADDSALEQDINKVEWWKKTNFYHIYIRSFRDANGDGEGDFRGIVEKLDYLQLIGVDTLLLSPFYSSPMKDVGYDIDDYTAVSSKFGTMQDFDNLVEGLKRRKMHLVVDFVPNHSSNKHKWFQCSERALVDPKNCGKYKDYYIWSDSRRFNNSYPNNWISVFGGGPAWTWSPIREQFYLHQFLPEQPDLNMTNPLVREEMKEIIRFWLRKGADGIRVDALSHILENIEGFPDEPENPDYRPIPPGVDISHQTPGVGLPGDPYDRLLHIHTKGRKENYELVGEWRAVTREPEFSRGSRLEQANERIIITEAYDPIEILSGAYGLSPDNKFADMPFNFHLFELSKDNLDPQKVTTILTRWMDAIRSKNWPDENGAMSPWNCWVTGNHDYTRIVNRVGEKNLETFKWITYLAPGVPVNYYGDELGIKNSNFNSIPQRTRDEGEMTRVTFRGPMAWTSEEPSGGFSSTSDTWVPLQEDYKVNNVESRLREQGKNSLKNFIALQKLRQQKLNLFVFGDLVMYPNHPVASSQIFSMARTHDRFGNILMVANFDAFQPEVVQLLPVDVTKIWKKPAKSPPARGKVLLLNYADNQSTDLVEGKEVDILGLVLAPLQAALIEY